MLSTVDKYYIVQGDRWELISGPIVGNYDIRASNRTSRTIEITATSRGSKLRYLTQNIVLRIICCNTEAEHPRPVAVILLVSTFIGYVLYSMIDKKNHLFGPFPHRCTFENDMRGRCIEFLKYVTLLITCWSRHSMFILPTNYNAPMQRAIKIHITLEKCKIQDFIANGLNAICD
jgi:hypothetical protein